MTMTGVVWSDSQRGRRGAAALAVLIGVTLGLVCGPQSAAAQGTREVFNVEDYGADGADNANDAEGIDAALAAVVANGGGVLYFPPGHFKYNAGASGPPRGLIVESPAFPNETPVVIQGDGPRLSRIKVVSVGTGTAFIRLSSTANMGSGINWGLGVRDLSLDIDAGLDIDGIVVDNLESSIIANVNVYQGRNALVVSESRSCTFRDMYLLNYSDTGIKIVGEIWASNRFEDIQINSHLPGSGWGFDYVHDSTLVGEVPGEIIGGPAGPTLYNVICNISGQGGFRFEHTGGGGVLSLFPFLNNCVADGPFGADNYLFKNVNAVMLSNCWSVHVGPGTAAYKFDGAFGVTMVGGVAASYSNDSPAFSFASGCRDITLSGVKVSGDDLSGYVGRKAYAADMSAHRNIVINNGTEPVLESPSDYGHLFNSFGGARVVSPLHVLTNTQSGGAPSEFGLLYDAEPTQAKYFRVNTGAELQILSSDHLSIISRLTDAGVWSATGGFQGSLQGTATGNVTKQERGQPTTTDDGQIDILGNLRAAVGFFAHPTALVTQTGQLNALDTGSGGQYSGGILNLGGAYGSASDPHTPFAAIQGYKANSIAGNHAGGLRFFTREQGQNYAERVRIDERGVLSVSLGDPVASATTISATGNVFHVTGDSVINEISGSAVRAGAIVSLIFDGQATLTESGNLRLKDGKPFTADDTIQLVFDGSYWYEISRSVN